MDSDSRSDDALMRAAQEGDLDVMGVLFSRYYSRVFGFLRSMARDAHAAEDLAQDVFVRAVKYRASYRQGSRFTAWLFQIARNVFYDWSKRSSKNAEVADCDYRLAEREETIDYGDAFGRGNDLELLREALDRLPSGKREIIAMSRFQGMSCREMATALDCKVGTIKARVFRALQALKVEFERLEKGKE